MKRLISLLLVFGVVCLGSLVAAAADLPQEEEAARAITGISVDVSSIHNSASTGDNLVDGDLTTTTKRWISKSGDQEPVATFTLPQEALVDAVVVYSGFSSEEADVYTVDTFVVEALQGGGWVAVATVEENRDYRCVVTFAPAKASSWRVRFIKSNTLGTSDNRARVFEIRLLEAK
ncbi:MAG TPA: hypothetical protein GXZ82_13960 [Firmicutes bacterium]|jgi:hypothetical protein|nr:hypothetical protein [Bacillota bacterium]